MSFTTKQLYRFEGFTLDVREKVLLRDGQIISLTPKVFETLHIFLTSAGNLVEKDDLMQQIWPDRFVEESNLAFNVKVLRKALGDDAAKPQFIETVRGRGYRFIGKVSHGDVGAVHQAPLISNDNPAIGRPQARWGIANLMISLVIVLSIGVIGGGFWYARSTAVSVPLLSAPFVSERLSTNGVVHHAVISPDGRIVAYTNKVGGEQQSVWIKQLDSSSNTQIVPPSDDFYYDLDFSPDGNFLYFVRGSQRGTHFTIYRVSILGGIATSIADGVQGGMGVSPDGQSISFVRCELREDEWCSLWIANAVDGKNEKKLVSRPKPIRFGDTKFSPDGRSIAYSVGQSRNGANDFGVAMVDIESGVEREITSDKFFDVTSVAWLPDRVGLLITGLRFPDDHFRIWHVSTVNRETRALTRDSEDYWGLSLDAAAANLVATKRLSNFILSLYSTDEHVRSRQVFADAVSVRFGPDGKLFVSSGRPGNVDIWSINTDGSEKWQLTNTPQDDLGAMTSPDGSTLFFASNRTGNTHVWQMKADGSDQKQVTYGDGGFPLAISPDGEVLYYHSALGRTLRRVFINEGREESVLDQPRSAFAVSPDCSFASFVDVKGTDPVLTVVSLPDGRIYGTYPRGKMSVTGMTWSSNSKLLYFVTAAGGSGPPTIWMQPLDTTVAIKIADLQGEQLRNDVSFAVSPDAKSFAVIQGSWTREAVMISGLD